jgi:hypothetical protein
MVYSLYDNDSVVERWGIGSADIEAPRIFSRPTVREERSPRMTR